MIGRHTEQDNTDPRNLPAAAIIDQVKELRGTANRVLAAPIDDCFALLQAVDRYPTWHPDVVRSVEVVQRDAGGRPSQVRTLLHFERGRLTRDFNLLMTVAAQQPDAVTLTRVPNEPADRERFEVRWRLQPEQDAATRVQLDIAAQLPVPRMLPLVGVGDAMAAGFIDAAADALKRPT